MIALFDADILIFRCGFAAERNIWFLSVPADAEPEQFSYKKEALARLDELVENQRSRVEGKDYKLWSERYLEPLENALGNVKATVRALQEDLGVTDYDSKFFLSGKNNFRYDVAVTRPYKGNRDTDHRPSYEEDIRDFIKRTWDTTVSDGEEADDLLGILQCRLGPFDSVIVTADKDLNMIPGLKCNIISGEKYLMGDDEAMSWFYTQLLTGDSTDNIPGLPKVGKVKAQRLLDGKSLEEQWSAVVNEYMSRGPEDWEAYLKEQGQLLWIRRETGQMWEPDLSEVSNWEDSSSASLF